MSHIICNLLLVLFHIVSLLCFVSIVAIAFGVYYIVLLCSCHHLDRDLRLSCTLLLCYCTCIILLCIDSTTIEL